jgi:hypothetical protein
LLTYGSEIWGYGNIDILEKLLKYIEHFFHSFSSFPQRNGNNETFVPLQIAVYFDSSLSTRQRMSGRPSYC